MGCTPRGRKSGFQLKARSRTCVFWGVFWGEALEDIQPDPWGLVGILSSLVGRARIGFPVSLFPALKPAWFASVKSSS